MHIHIPLCLQWHFPRSSALYVERLVSLAGFVSRRQDQLLDQSGMSYLGAGDWSTHHLLHLCQTKLKSAIWHRLELPTVHEIYTYRNRLTIYVIYIYIYVCIYIYIYIMFVMTWDSTRPSPWLSQRPPSSQHCQHPTPVTPLPCAKTQTHSSSMQLQQLCLNILNFI